MQEEGFRVHVDTGDPYGSLIQGALVNDFHGIAARSASQVLDAVVQEIVGTSQIRFGPMPNPESLVAMRTVVRACIEAGQPIPFLCPWGSKKTVNNRSIDVAEVAGLKRLHCLSKRVRQHFSPGIQVNVRLEDVGGWWLFRDEGVVARDSSDRYVADFDRLVRILNLGFVRVVRESELMSEEAYVAAVEAILPAFLAYIEETDHVGLDGYERLESWKALAATGWQGLIPMEQRDFYRSRYARLYGSDPAIQTLKLAEYLAGSLARYKLRATGVDPSWGSQFLQLNFALPVPGAPQGIVERRIHYRTLPCTLTRNHIPAWRARGYYRVNGDGARPALASWCESGLQLNPFVVTLARGGEEITIAADYVVEAA